MSDGDCCPDPTDASCCADFYEQPAVRYLLGDSFHPGGVKLTLEVAELAGLSAGDRLLDVACGVGTSLRALIDEVGVIGVGLDASEEARPDDTVARACCGPHFKVGDAHQIPVEDASFDAVLCECALSTFTDQALALAEMFRVLRPGGLVAITDMVVEGPLPDGVLEWVQLGTCLARAQSTQGYRELLVSAGFKGVQDTDATWALRDLVRQLKRQLVGAAAARATGRLPQEVVFDLKRGRDGLRAAAKAMDTGHLGYGVLIAMKPEVRGEEA